MCIRDRIFGLVLSVVLTGALATYLANYIQKHLWIAYIGLGFILLVAIQLVIGGLVDLEILNINEKYIKYFWYYQVPVFSIDDQGSLGGRFPSWSISIDILSGDFTNAIWPSLGGLFIV